MVTHNEKVAAMSEKYCILWMEILKGIITWENEGFSGSRSS